MSLILPAVWAGLVVVAVAAVASIAAHRWPRARQPARTLVPVAFAAVTVPLALLVFAFFRGDVSVFYVWENVETSYPWWLRVAGLWGGQAGTYLLWAWFVLGFVALEQYWETGLAVRRVRSVLVSFSLLLLVAPIVLDLGLASEAFGLTADRGFMAGAGGPSPLSVRPDGDGLNPLLESPYMAIHPFVEFAAYGLSTLPFAYGAVHLFSGTPYRERARVWGRAAWLAFLVALTLGAMWAYNVLSFGGYWIWDPVEVGNLLPFLALTVLLHAIPARESGGFGLLAPTSAALPLVLVLFSSFVTRSGLWSSVHAFLPTGLSIAIQDPMARLSASVANSFQARYATSLFAAALGTLSAGVSAYHARTRENQTARAAAVGAAVLYGIVALAGLAVPERLVAMLHGLGLALGWGNPLVGIVALVVLAALPLVYGLAVADDELAFYPRTRAGQLTLAIAVLTLTTLATGLLLILGVNGYSEAVFTSRAPFVSAGILAAIGVSLLPGSLRRRGLAIGLAIAVGFLVRWGTGSWALAALAPCLVVAGGLLYRFVDRARPTGGARARERAGLLTGAGVLGLVQWTSPGTVTLAGVSLGSPAAFVPVGLVASLACLILVFVETHEGVPSWAGPLAGLVAVGYGLGAVLAVAAWLVDETDAVAMPIRSGSVPLLHAGVALLVLGVAVSTFGTQTWAFQQADPLVRGEPAQLGPHEIELVDGALLDEDGDERVDVLEATVHVRRGGTFLSEETLRLKFSSGTGFTTRGSFAPDGSPAARTWWGDLALNANTTTPLAMRVSGAPGENSTWVVANGPPPRSLEGQIDAVSMGVERLPAVNLVWGSIPLVALGAVTHWIPRRSGE